VFVPAPRCVSTCVVAARTYRGWAGAPSGGRHVSVAEVNA
jgi:hypothetical protein